MPLDNYMLNGENIAARVTGANWVWMATSKRIVRYRKTGDENDSSKTTETIEDVSYGEVTSIRMSSERKEANVLGALAAMGLGALLILAGFLADGNNPLMAAGALVFLFGLLLAALANSKKESVLRLDGTTVLSENWDRDWTLQTEDVDPDEVAEFMKAVRKRAK